MKPLRAAAGFTLIETVISIVVVGIALAGFVSVFTLTFARGADPLRERQALAVAEAYLEEILLRPFADPDAAAVEANRALYDDVSDYDALADNGCLITPATAACDQNGNPIAGLAGYSVAVAVTAATVGPPNVNALRVQVTVTAPGSNTPVQLVGYRLALP